MKNYSTAHAVLEHKAFSNLPMETGAPAVVVPPAGAKHGTKVRNLEIGEGYKDSFVTHPIPGNYRMIFDKMELDRNLRKAQIEAERDNYPTLLELVERGYTNVGRAPDEQHQNSIRDRLRQSGASDEEIEVILKEGRLKQLREMAVADETREQAMRRHLLSLPMGARVAGGPGKAAKPMRGAPADPNVYNFGTPAPLAAHLDNRRAEPGNLIFEGARAQGVNPAGPPGVPAVSAAGIRERFTMRRPPALPEEPRATGPVRLAEREATRIAPLPASALRPAGGQTMVPALMDVRTRSGEKVTTTGKKVAEITVPLSAAGSTMRILKKAPGRR
jgi:hypothetical protein